MENGNRPKWTFQLSDAATQTAYHLHSIGELIVFLEQQTVADDSLQLLFDPQQNGDLR